MNHFSLESMGKENQKKLLAEQLHEQAVNGYRRNNPSARVKIRAILVITSLIVYFWFFI